MSPIPKRKLEYADIPTSEDGTRYELIDGELFVNPSPSRVHQRVSRRLQRQLEDYFHARAIGEVFNAPLDVILTPHDVLQPDLLVVADRSDTSNRGVEKPPLLVVEVLSPSTRNRDLGLKCRRYAELGVRHFWIVDPDRKRVECHRSVDGAFRLLVEAEGDTRLEHPDWNGLVFDLTALWLDHPFS